MNTFLRHLYWRKLWFDVPETTFWQIPVSSFRFCESGSEYQFDLPGREFVDPIPRKVARQEFDRVSQNVRIFWLKILKDHRCINVILFQFTVKLVVALIIQFDYFHTLTCCKYKMTSSDQNKNWLCHFFHLLETGFPRFKWN